MNVPSSSFYYFLVFLVVGVFALSATPFILHAFASASETIIIENMKKAQTDLYFYDAEYGGFQYVCIAGNIVVLQNDLLLEYADGLSCTVSENYRNVSLYTTLNKGKKYCVDSLGYQGFISSEKPPQGRCLK